MVSGSSSSDSDDARVISAGSRPASRAMRLSRADFSRIISGGP